MLPLKGIIFIGLNVLRLMSMISLILVFSSTILLMVNDSNAYNSLKSQGLLQSTGEDCDYFPQSDVPTTSWGIFWVELDRFWVLLICIFCFFSEFSFKVFLKFYFNFLTILGPSFSTISLGFIQLFISSSLLSHYVEGFPLVTPWLLFFVGLLNILAGLSFGNRGKLKRSLRRSNRDLYEQKYQNDLEKSTIPISTAFRNLTNTRIDEKGIKPITEKSISVYSKPSGRSDENISLLHRQPSNVRSVRSAIDAFHNGVGGGGGGGYGTSNIPPHQVTSCDPNSYFASIPNVPLPSTNDEVLRWRARQENLRAEKVQEMMENNQTPSNLSKHFQYDLQNDIAIPRKTPSNHHHDSISLQSQIKRAQQGMSNDLTSPSQQNELPFKRSSTLSNKKSKFKRRTLVLSKVVQQVRRGSLAAIQATTRSSQLRTMPGTYKTYFKPKGKPTPWMEVERKEIIGGPITTENLYPPQPSYRPGRTSTTTIDLDNVTENERMTFYQTPITDKFRTSYR